MDTSRQLFFSIIIPVFNRPQEIDELLQSLTLQTYRDFEVLVVEDGSSEDARSRVEMYKDRLDLHYYYIPNGGQGFARNFGFGHANGDYFIVFDSDCVIPPDYLSIVNDALTDDYLDAFGGPDAAHPSFSVLQKAISYAMTAPLTTGGIRGNKRHVGVFHPRSFNMGISREVWEQTGGFRWANQSEDMELSIRLRQLGFRVGLISDAVVYHKRRATLSQFFRQAYSFGQGRIRIYRHFRMELKPVHVLPALFTLGLGGLLLANAGSWLMGLMVVQNVGVAVLKCATDVGNLLFLGFLLAVFFHALWSSRNFQVATWSIAAAVCQLLGYGLGFLQALYTSFLGAHRMKKEGSR